MLDDVEYERWRATARDARENARALRDDGVHHWACFFAEQAAQFATKALLHAVGAGAWGHDLGRLRRELQDALDAPVPSDAGDAMLRLSRHYIATRYPDAHPGGTPAAHYTPGDAAQALDDLDAVLAWVDETWERLERLASED